MPPRHRAAAARRFVVAGSVMLDLLIGPVARIPRWDENTFVEDIHARIGGLAANAAVCLARLGASVGLVGCVGDDPIGDKLRAWLQRAGVNVRYLRRVRRRTTSLSFGFVGGSGQRFFVVSRGANEALVQRDFQRIAWRNVALLHLGGFFHLPGVEADLPALLSSLRRHGVQTSLDLAWDPEGRWLQHLSPLLAHLDFIFPNGRQLQQLTKERDVRRGARALRAQGVRGVVVKLGAEGCYGDTETWNGFVPAFPVSVRDTSGAGDNFDAAFLYGVEKSWHLETCARFANVMAAASTRAYGAAAALPSRVTAMRWMKRFYTARRKHKSTSQAKLSFSRKEQ